MSLTPDADRLYRTIVKHIPEGSYATVERGIWDVYKAAGLMNDGYKRSRVTHELINAGFIAEDISSDRFILPMSDEDWAERLHTVIKEAGGEVPAKKAADKAGIFPHRETRNRVAKVLLDAGRIESTRDDDGQAVLRIPEVGPVVDNLDDDEEDIRPPKRDPELEYPDSTPAVDMVPEGTKDNGRGLQAAKLWTHRLMACSAKGTTWKIKGIGAAIREYIHASNGTVYVSGQTLADSIGVPRTHISGARSLLVKRGWLTATGENRGRGARVYKLTIPACGCRSCLGARTETPTTKVS